MLNVNRKRGFTLIEIMIVVLIIGILMAIAVPNFVKARTQSRQNSCIASLKQVDAAKEQWAMDNRKNTGDTPVWGDLTPTYVRTQPVCPAGGTYTINAIGTLPVCNQAGHVLP